MNKQVKLKKKEKEGELTHFQLNLRTYTQPHTPTVVRGVGINGTLPRRF